MQILLDEVKRILPSIHGWCCYEKASKFIEIIIDKKPDLCLEIGVFGGSSYIPQALALKYNKKGKIIGIDPWTKEAALEEMQDAGHRKWWAELDIEQIYQHCIKNTKLYNVESYCELIREKAENVVNKFENESIDILHIDGNHSEPLAYKDATLYLPKVKIGGIIFFDDIWWTEVDNHVTTRKAITYLLQYCERIGLINNDCLVLKKTCNVVEPIIVQAVATANAGTV